jgi:phage/plasmid-associated DNA primase
VARPGAAGLGAAGAGDRLTGYADRALPILLGERGRGKTQVVALLMSVLGNYAHAADPRLLNGLDNAHASIIYALKGRRLSFIDEGPREGRLGQERLKQLTGGGDLTGNQMNRNPITFTPTHTLVLTANDDPVLTDPAIRDRVRLIPCEGDPDAVRIARRAIGHTSGGAWRREAPGVLAP